MRPLTTWALVAALLTGCSQNNKEQVWFITAEASDDPVVDVLVTHNFTSGVMMDGFDTDWVVTDEVSTSDSLFVAQFVELDGDEEFGALLIIDGVAYPGVEDDDGGWEFTWEAFDNSQDNEVHDAGYFFNTLFDGSSETTISWSVDKKTKIASGSIEMSSNETTIWTESDNFDQAIVGIYPQIPIFNYLIDEYGYPIENAPGADDCTTDPCTLQSVETLSLEFDFTAVQTDYADEDVFNAVDDAGQPYGN